MNLFFELIINLFKSRCLTVYIRIIERLRGFFIRGLTALFCLMLVISGFLIIHVALFFYLPWDLETKALVLLIVGLTYFFVPLTLICWLYSKPQWIKMSGAEEMIENLSKKS